MLSMSILPTIERMRFVEISILERIQSASGSSVEIEDKEYFRKSKS